MPTVCEPYVRHRAALPHWNAAAWSIFAAGTGNPFFTTDTAATLRAIEMGCDGVAKATQVDGVYDSDPQARILNAKRYDHLTYAEGAGAGISRSWTVRQSPLPAITTSGNCVFHRRAGQPDQALARHGRATMIHDPVTN